jgi:outer membrane usher protein
LAGELVIVKPQYEAGAGIGYSERKFGSLSLDYARTRAYSGNDLAVSAVTYSKSLPHNLSLFLTFRSIREQESSTEVFVGINVHPGKEISVSAQYRKSDGGNAEALQVQKNPPIAEGIGYRASFERTDAGDGAENRFNPFVQYNSRYGIVSAEYDAVTNGPRTSQVTAAGAVVYVGDTFGLTRPVNDSFGLVNTGGLGGIRVYQNGQDMGRTDPDGNLFIPDLGSYSNNQISIEDKDIPMNYSISGVVQYLSPPLRSGALLASMSRGSRRLQEIEE